MDKVFRPEKLELDLGTSADGGNANKFVHWKTTMEHFVETLKESPLIMDRGYTEDSGALSVC